MKESASPYGKPKTSPSPPAAESPGADHPVVMVRCSVSGLGVVVIYVSLLSIGQMERTPVRLS